MATLTDFRLALSHEAEMAVRFITERGQLLTYRVVLLVWEHGEQRAVRLFDNAHGVHDMHRYSREGVKREAEKLHHASPDEALHEAMRAIRDGYEEMIDSWRR